MALSDIKLPGEYTLQDFYPNITQSTDDDGNPVWLMPDSDTGEYRRWRPPEDWSTEVQGESKFITDLLGAGYISLDKNLGGGGAAYDPNSWGYFNQSYGTNIQSPEDYFRFVYNQPNAQITEDPRLGKLLNVGQNAQVVNPLDYNPNPNEELIRGLTAAAIAFGGAGLLSGAGLLGAGTAAGTGAGAAGIETAVAGGALTGGAGAAGAGAAGASLAEIAAGASGAAASGGVAAGVAPAAGAAAGTGAAGAGLTLSQIIGTTGGTGTGILGALSQVGGIAGGIGTIAKILGIGGDDSGGGGTGGLSKILEELTKGGGGTGGTSGSPLGSIADILAGIYGNNKSKYLDNLARPGRVAADQLSMLLNDPSSIMQLPGYQQLLASRETALSRRLAAQGYNMSGNEKVALADLGGQQYMEFRNAELDRLYKIVQASVNPQTLTEQMKGSALNRGTLGGLNLLDWLLKGGGSKTGTTGTNGTGLPTRTGDVGPDGRVFEDEEDLEGRVSTGDWYDDFADYWNSSEYDDLIWSTEGGNE